MPHFSLPFPRLRHAISNVSRIAGAESIVAEMRFFASQYVGTRYRDAAAAATQVCEAA